MSGAAATQPSLGVRRVVGADVAALLAATRAAAEPALRTGVNPRVGAALLDAAGGLLSVGVHAGPGSPHAEVAALRALGPDAHPHTAVVTLEPCAHVGNSGACTQALLDSGIRRVLFADRDPNPVAAGGAEVLRAAGMEVVWLRAPELSAAPDLGPALAEVDELDPEWLTAARLARPHVRLKLALTIDGRIAALDGTSRWITGPAARRDAHRLRARADAVLVGTGTVEADDPQLTVRDEADRPLPARLQPLRVILGKRQPSPRARVLDDAAATRHLPLRDPAQALQHLHADGVRRLFVEGGAVVASAFLRAGLVDELLTYTAPALLGAGACGVADLGITTIADALRLQVLDVARIGVDVRTRYRLGDPPDPPAPPGHAPPSPPGHAPPVLRRPAPTDNPKPEGKH